MADRVDDDLGLGGLIENKIRIRQRRQTANNRIICTNTDIGMNQEQANKAPYSSLNALRPLGDCAAIVPRIELRSASAGTV
jgi:hypothetical protein